MLILERNLGQKIKVGDEITIYILAQNSGQIKIGIDAPCSVAVNRSEIYHKKRSDFDEQCGVTLYEKCRGNANMARLVITDGNCSQLQRGETLINLLDLNSEYDGIPVNQFCFEDACDGQIKIWVDLGLNPDSDTWDKEFTKKLPSGFEDFFDAKNENEFFYAVLKSRKQEK